jgi:NAD(P)-dependent dehydrogenase (short-subunit alcohol dehydrogenase family)
VLPGKVATPMLATIQRHEALGPLVAALPVPLGRDAQPEELASAIAFLLGPDARYVHGALLHADGGVDAQVRPDAL